MKDEEVTYHVNKDWPCKSGCIFYERPNGELVLSGDCRSPWSEHCFAMKQDRNRDQHRHR